LWKGKGHTGWIFFREEDQHVPINTRCTKRVVTLQPPLHQFLTFLKHDRGFADATIVNRERSLKPLLGWLVAEDVPRSTVSPVVITKYFTGIVAGR
jgi:hypothetical protein